ncbi:MAG: hypothetical protein AB8G22_23985 [Saprospiraceae bacterium]
MNRKERKKHTELLESAIKKIKKLGYRNVKAATLDDYEDPRSFSRAKDDETFVPDITATIRGRKDYFDVALKTDRDRRLVTKWRLMDTLARMKNRKFTLLVPRGSYRFANDIVDQYSINPQLVRI